MGIIAEVKILDDDGNIKDVYKISPSEIRASGISTTYIFEFEYGELNVKNKAALKTAINSVYGLTSASFEKVMTFKEMLNKFSDVFPSAKIEDYRPACPEIFQVGEVGITIWLKNGDMVVYYPKAESEV